jgi:hypothetical protein
MLILWSVALALLLAAGLFCWLVVVPVWQVRTVVRVYAKESYGNRLITSPPLPGSPEMVAVRRLGGGSEAARKLSLFLRYQGVTTPLGRVAVSLLGFCGESAVPTLARIILQEDASLRMIAVRGLGEIGGERAVVLLKTALKDQDKDVRQAAAEALSKIRGEAEKK